MADDRVIKLRDVQVNSDRVVLPSGSEIVASYNWSTTSTGSNPRIIVPGASRVYVSPKSRSENPPDNPPRRVRRNQHVSARCRGFTLTKRFNEPDEEGYEPLFHSLGVCSPGFDMDTVDVLTDKGNLRDLLRFCDGPVSRSASFLSPMDYRDEPFTFFVHAIGDDRKNGPTLVFTRAAETGEEEYYPNYCAGFHEKLTEKDRSAPADTGPFRFVTKMSLDGVALLVRSGVSARETVGTNSAAVGTPTTQDDLVEQLGSLPVSSGGKDEPNLDTAASTAKSSSSSGRQKNVPKRLGLTCINHGELLGDEPHLLELRTKNERYSHEIYWKDYFWSMMLGDVEKIVLGLHKRGTVDRLQQLPVKEVKARAEREGSSSMVYLANTLRDVIKASHCLMAAAPASSSSTSSQGGAGSRRSAVVVEYSPPTVRDEGTLCVRLAVPEDEDVAPLVTPCLPKLIFYQR